MTEQSCGSEKTIKRVVLSDNESRLARRITLLFSNSIACRGLRPVVETVCLFSVADIVSKELRDELADSFQTGHERGIFEEMSQDKAAWSTTATTCARTEPRDGRG